MQWQADPDALRLAFPDEVHRALKQQRTGAPADDRRRRGCPECRRLRDQFADAIRSGDRAGAERVMAARGLHDFAAHWGPK
ncbi:hypothetical protein [Streptomyces huiliensis]|uniref:hypothetical protein n=1 Tax=Streptomyces huiliensis TaxID=2876027 RepID=UPI001CC027A9|nr:hypothetical protein [Streptomyces huiliensis]MBZ4319557.1 hypothetical protein [Streptomyces huiliensis]